MNHPVGAQEVIVVFKLLERVFSSANDRAIRRFQPDVAAVNAIESKIKVLSDAELQGKTAEFRTKLEQGAPLDSIRHEAFAVAREASWRVRHSLPRQEVKDHSRRWGFLHSIRQTRRGRIEGMKET